MWQSVLRSLNDHPVGYAIWAAGIAVALALGARTARAGALILLANLLLSVVWYSDDYQHVFWALLLEDTLVLVAFAALLIMRPKRWIVWATAVQAVSVLCHFPKLLTSLFPNWLFTRVLGAVPPLSYAWIATASGYLLILVLVVGAVLEFAGKRCNRPPL